MEADYIEMTLQSDGPRWLVDSARWLEHLGQPYRAVLTVHREEPDAPATELLGTGVELVLRRRGVEEALAGIVSEVREGPLQQGWTGARLIVEPALAALRHRKDTRIFQKQAVPAILEAVLGEGLGAFGRSVSNELTRSYAPREYTVQYEETDFEFVHRLMEEEGIAYYFLHDGGAERMVLTDQSAQHPAIEGESGEVLHFAGRTADATSQEGLFRLESVCRLTGSQVSVRSFDWTHPALPVAAASGGSGDGPALESYEVRATVTLGAFSDIGYGSNDSGDQARIMNELQTRDRHFVDGGSTSLALRCGHRFEVVEHPHAGTDGGYLAVAVEHFVGVPRADIPRAEDFPEVRYFNRVTALPSSTAWRPDRTRDRPRIPGVQTATVVGPGEIHTDEHGRIKVQFHWDRLGAGDEHSSCWIRVMQSLAGPGWGFSYIPRVGQEVVVTFVNGDPDQPIVSGAIYNGAHPPPLDLPAEKTRMTIKSNSSPGGGGYNELRFEDMAGAEEIWLHGQRDWNTLIEHDLTRTVGHDESQRVVRHRSRNVGGDESVHIDQNQTLQVVMNQSETVLMNRTRAVGLVETLDVGGDRIRTVGHDETVQIANDEQRTVGQSATHAIVNDLSETVGNDRARQVGNDEVVAVGNDQTLSVVRNRVTAIGQDDVRNVGGNRVETVHESASETVKGDAQRTVRGDESVNVGKNQKVTIGVAQSITVTAARQLAVGALYALNVGGNYMVNAGMSMLVTAGKSFKVTCGDSVLEMKKDGNISLTGKQIEITASGGNVVVKGDMVELNPPG